MEVIPAIDLRGGRCVRLYQGDFSRELLSEDPLSVALKWQDQGAARLHVVDLDGAASGRPGNLATIRQIAACARVPLQVGGGVRDLDTALTLLNAGADRVVLGTAAVEHPDLEKVGPGRGIVSVDARDGKVAVRGWTEGSHVDSLALLRRMAQLGVSRFVYTDIAQDGTLSEPNFAAVESAIAAVDCPLIAAGGISSIDHLVRLAELGAEGAIVGTALFTGAVDLPQALRTLRQD